MQPVDFKALKKLADICRKAGIKSFKSADFEFTLTDEVPLSDYKKAKEFKQLVTASTSSEQFKSDSLTEDELLFWSSADPIKETDPGAK